MMHLWNFVENEIGIIINGIIWIFACVIFKNL